MQKTVTGGLKWRKEEFLLETLEDTLIAVEGYLDERDETERVLRRHANFCVAPYVEKGFQIEKHWPIRGDEQLEIQKSKDDRLRAKLLANRQKALAKKNGNQT